jgi:hypothetical protein
MDMDFSARGVINIFSIKRSLADKMGIGIHFFLSHPALCVLSSTVFSFFVILFPYFSWGQPSSGKAKPGVALVFSSNVYGEVEPCG